MRHSPFLWLDTSHYKRAQRRFARRKNAQVSTRLTGLTFLHLSDGTSGGAGASISLRWESR